MTLSPEFGDPPTLVEWTRKNYPGLMENFGLSFFNRLVDNQKIGLKVARMKWWLYSLATEKHDLLLADHPCIFHIGPRKAFMAAGSERVANILRQQRPRHLLP